MKSGGIPTSERTNAAAASDRDAIWEEAKDGLSITQGSALPYIEPLNEGHSKQAAIGFLDVIAAQMEDTLDAALAELAGRI